MTFSFCFVVGAVRPATRTRHFCTALARPCHAGSRGLGPPAVGTSGRARADARRREERRRRVLASRAVNAFKPHLASVADYPYTKVDARVKLDQNESPDDFPPSSRPARSSGSPALPWNRYPELHAEDVRAAVARHEGWPEEGVVIAPGSNVLVLALTMAAAPGDRHGPGLPVLPRRRAGHRHALARRLARRGLRPARSRSCSRRSTGPRACSSFRTRTRPPASSSRPATVEQLAERARARDALLVVDEAYHAFAGTDARPLARGNPTSPCSGPSPSPGALGGIRAGYLLAAPKVASVVRACVAPFCIPAHTAAILLTVLESPGYVAELAARIRAERDRLFQGLSAHPTWRPYPSAANYLLVRTPDAKAAFDSPARARPAGPAPGSLPRAGGLHPDLGRHAAPRTTRCSPRPPRRVDRR